MIDKDQYPNAYRFLSEHPGWTIDDAIRYLETNNKTEEK